MSDSNKLYQLFPEKIGGRHITTFIAQSGVIFYDPNIGELRIGDGETPGGLPVYVETIGPNFDGGSAISIFGSGDINYDGGSSTTLGGSIIDGGNS